MRPPPPTNCVILRKTLSPSGPWFPLHSYRDDSKSALGTELSWELREVICKNHLECIKCFDVCYFSLSDKHKIRRMLSKTVLQSRQMCLGVLLSSSWLFQCSWEDLSREWTNEIFHKAQVLLSQVQTALAVHKQTLHVPSFLWLRLLCHRVCGRNKQWRGA